MEIGEILLEQDVAPERAEAWRCGRLDGAELAEALDLDRRDLERLLETPALRRETILAGNGAARRLSGRLRVGLAAVASLHRCFGLPLPQAAEAISGIWPVCESVLRTLDFIPPDGGREADPLRLFVSYASEAIAIPAIDEYLDLYDGRHLVWRRPRSDAYRLVCDLHRLDNADIRPGTAMPGAAYLEALARLRERPEQVGVRLGILDNSGFRALKQGVDVDAPAMLDRVDILTPAPDRSLAYGSMASINVSLAARSFKRRMLALDVIDFGTRPDPGGSPHPAPRLS